ncbi:MAG: acyl--CoA ligase [Clostridiales bacterium]|nr:acyl--CoA ligase [Clostridiales bacterium]
MAENMELTGYSSIDKPWEKYYRNSASKDLSEYHRVYDMIFASNRMDAEALGFLDGDCSWTFGKLKKTTDKCMDALIKNDVKQGDTVLLGITNTPEIVAVIIAIVSIGAVVKLFDIRASESDIKEYIEADKCKCVIALETIVLPKIDSIICDTSVEKVFVLRPSNSLSTIEKAKYAFKHILGLSDIKTEPLPNDGRHFELTNIINSGDEKNTCFNKFNDKNPAFKVQSSGTTGKAKTIVHSERSAVEFAKSISRVDLPIGEGKKVLVALPPWIAYGIGDAILMSLALGAKVMLCADFEPNAVYRNIGNFTLSYAAPFHYRYIREHYNELSEKQKNDLSRVECMITGGDKYSATENEEDEELFKTIIVNGYGNNEDWGALSVNPVKANRYGSVGIPKYGEITIIYDSDTEQELKYGEIGEICTLSQTCFLEYQNNPEATSNTKRLHKDGKMWLHTGDLGYIDSDGYIYISGRNERVITRLGFKLSAYTIEDAITSLPLISECVTVEVPDKEEEHVPMAFIVKSNDCSIGNDELIQAVDQACHHLLKDNEIPKYIKVEERLRYTDNNKYDFRYYERLGKAYVESL